MLTKAMVRLGDCAWVDNTCGTGTCVRHKRHTRAALWKPAYILRLEHVDEVGDDNDVSCGVRELIRITDAKALPSPWCPCATVLDLLECAHRRRGQR